MNVNNHIAGIVLIRDVIYMILVVDLFRPQDNAFIYIASYLALSLLAFYWYRKLRKFCERNRVTNRLTFPRWYWNVSRLMDIITFVFIFWDTLSPLPYAFLVFIHLAITVQLIAQRR
jgi:L-asparagine transporter-like permease